MKTMIDLEGARTLVTDTKKLVDDAITAHNSNENAHGNLNNGLQFVASDTKPSEKNIFWLDTSEHSGE